MNRIFYFDNTDNGKFKINAHKKTVVVGRTIYDVYKELNNNVKITDLKTNVLSQSTK